MHNVLTVKNTFLNFDDIDSCSVSETMGRVRSLSDPGIAVRDPCDAISRALEPLSDVTSDNDVGSTTDDEYYDHGDVRRDVRRQSICSSFSKASIAAPQLSGETSDMIDPISQVREADAATLEQEVERLMLTNRDLKESNQALQEACNAQSTTAPEFLPVSQTAFMPTTPTYVDMCNGVKGYVYFAVPVPSHESLGKPWWNQETQLIEHHRCPEVKQRDMNVESCVSSEKNAAAAIPNETRTTVMLRNLPNNYTSSKLVDMLDSEGFAGKYDFVYLPMDFTRLACLGYAFVNLVDPADASEFWAVFDRYTRWVIPSKKQCLLSWSDPHQGLQANVDRYKNSPVMHESVPDEYKPRLLRDGVQIPFPPPTRKIRMPRLRR